MCRLCFLMEPSTSEMPWIETQWRHGIPSRLLIARSALPRIPDIWKILEAAFEAPICSFEAVLFFEATRLPSHSVMFQIQCRDSQGFSGILRDSQGSGHGLSIFLTIFRSASTFRITNSVSRTAFTAARSSAPHNMSGVKKLMGTVYASKT